MDNKSLIERLAKSCGRPKEEVQKLLDSLTEIVGEAASEMDTISIPSFGQFESKKRLERIAVHPSTGARLLLPPKIVVGFKPSALLKQKIREA